jgi:NTE family protein
MASSLARRHYAILVLAVCSLALSGCVALNIENTRLEKVDPMHGYRPRSPAQRRDPGKAIIFLAFSGGGTRAAALAYGVLEELRATKIGGGESQSLLDEVDTISGVSGGSFTAAYYGLYGERIFDEFEPRFLRKNIQWALILQALKPWNLVRLLTPSLNRSDLASLYYHENVFDNATFADLTVAGGPKIHINATDLSSGDRFTFNQDSFDLLCSDIDPLPISTAVAASSAVPMLLSPVTFRNHAGTCSYDPPAWVKQAIERSGSDKRLDRSVKSYLRAQDAKKKSYFHLIDGSISDNLGLRVATEFVHAAGGAKGALAVQAAEVPQHMAIVVVNAEIAPNQGIDLSKASPSLAMLFSSVSGAQIRRYNFETLVLTEELLHSWGRQLSTDTQTVSTYMIDVDFEAVEDDAERDFLNGIPTSFTLSDDAIDRLRRAGRQVLRQSPQFKALVEALQ